MRDCDYCGERCWAEVPDGTPGHILDAIAGRGAEEEPGRRPIMPTCDGGQEASRNRSGWSHTDIVLEVQWAEAETEPDRGHLVRFDTDAEAIEMVEDCLGRWPEANDQGSRNGIRCLLADAREHLAGRPDLLAMVDEIIDWDLEEQWGQAASEPRR